MFKNKVTANWTSPISPIKDAAVKTLEFMEAKTSFANFFAKKSEPLNCQLIPDKEVWFNTKSNMVRDEAKELIQSNWTSWTREDFEGKLRNVLNYVGDDSSVENVVHSSTVALWMLLNAVTCRHDEENILWTNFVKMLEDYDKTIVPDKAPSEGALKAMKEALAGAFVDISKEQMKDQVSQSSDPVNTAEKYVERARELEEGFLEKLRKLDSRAISNVKSVERALEKANADYGGDASRVLDYLRSIIHIHVDVGDTTEKILQRYQRAKAGLPGRIVRLKAFGDVNELPRVLTNLEYEGIICEVQIHFRFRGFDEDYQRKKHLVYELIRKPMRRINEKDHAIDLLLDLCIHGGLQIDREDLLGDIQDFTYESEEQKGAEAEVNKVILNLKLTKRKKTIEQKYKIKEVESQDGSLIGFKLSLQNS
jgi:hypothetical protein